MAIPKYVELLRNQHFKCEGRELTILVRTHDINWKGYCYLLDYKNHQYISNLKYIGDDVFLFDFRNGPKYNLILNESNGQITIKKLEG